MFVRDVDNKDLKKKNIAVFVEALYSLGTRGVYLALGSIQCFIVVSNAPFYYHGRFQEL